MSTKRNRRPIATALVAAFAAAAGLADAAPLTQTTNWGTLDPGCVSEGAACASDSAFSPATGGYRAGGQVAWSIDFDKSAFGSISSIQMEVLVVGLLFDGSIGANPGNYFALDGVPIGAFTGVTDHRDTQTFGLPVNLAPGAHTFSVVAYGYEGWAGVDVATLTVSGDSDAPGGPGVPEPGTAALIAAAAAGLALRRRAAAS